MLCLEVTTNCSWKFSGAKFSSGWQAVTGKNIFYVPERSTIVISFSGFDGNGSTLLAFITSADTSILLKNTPLVTSIRKVHFLLRAWAANDTARAQINNIPKKRHVIPLLKALPKVYILLKIFIVSSSPKPIPVCDTKTERIQNNWIFIDMNRT